MSCSDLSPLPTALLPSMIRRRQGHVVAISSIQGKISVPFRSACEYTSFSFPRSLYCFLPVIKTTLSLSRIQTLEKHSSRNVQGRHQRVLLSRGLGSAPALLLVPPVAPVLCPPECRPLSVPPPSAHRCCPTATLPHVPPEFFYMGSNVQNWGTLYVVLWFAYSI